MAKLKSNTRIFGTANVDGILTVGQVTPVAATSNTSGSLQVVGGLGMTGDLYANSITLSGNTITSNTGSIHLQENSGLYGAVRLSVLSDTGIVGALVDANSATVATADFGLKANNEQFNIRLEGRPGSLVKANSGTSEIQFAFRNSAGGLPDKIMVIANNGVLINAVSSTSNTTGALIVQGGVGVSGNVVANTARVNLLNIPTETSNISLFYDNTITSWNYSGKSFSLAAQETGPSGIFFKPDGTKMYIIGSTGDDVNEYDLSTPWEINTATFLQVSAALIDTAPTDIFFKPDGTKMYLTGTTNDTIYEYDLSTPWNISTLALLQSFSLATQDTAPQGIFFRSDGIKMYMVGSTNDAVYEYDLSSAWNISTLTFLQSFSVVNQESGPIGITFNSTGTKMYIIGSTGDDINEYRLSTPWNISTAVFYNNFYIGFQETTPSGLFINESTNTAYVTGSGTDSVYQYDTKTNSLELIANNFFIDGSLYANSNFITTGSARIDGTLSAVDITSSTLAGAVAASTLTSSSTVTLSSTTQTITIGSGQTTGPILIGGTTATGTITVGQSSGTQSVNISGAPIVLTKGQLQFPATQNASANANTLDDYEEGTFTPTLTGSSSNPVYTASLTEGRYTKIGRLVNFSILIIVTGVSSQGSGTIQISGLPFTNASNGYANPVIIGYNDVWDTAFPSCFFSGVHLVPQPTGVTQAAASWGATSSSQSNLSTGYLSISGTYSTAT